ncbi:MAG: hypothetical protein JSS66_00110 [Armatimonadetes bacterium]|nr:hypothetical protein [Armatimonadota bacterium]
MSTRRFICDAARHIADASQALGNIDRPETLSCEMALASLRLIGRHQVPSDMEWRELESYRRWIDDRRLGIFSAPDLPVDEMAVYMKYLAVKIERSSQRH